MINIEHGAKYMQEQKKASTTTKQLSKIYNCQSTPNLLTELCDMQLDRICLDDS